VYSTYSPIYIFIARATLVKALSRSPNSSSSGYLVIADCRISSLKRKKRERERENLDVNHRIKERGAYLETYLAFGELRARRAASNKLRGYSARDAYLIELEGPAWPSSLGIDEARPDETPPALRELPFSSWSSKMMVSHVRETTAASARRARLYFSRHRQPVPRQRANDERTN